MTEQANINKDNKTTEAKKLFSPKAGMEKSKAAEVIMPKSTSDPPIAGVTTYSGMKTESRPNAISWKKNPKRHIARGLR
jgi:hypothetical protein